MWLYDPGPRAADPCVSSPGQVFRALRIPITGRMLSDILSRLVETVAEQGEDMQVRTPDGELRALQATWLSSSRL